MLFSFLIGPLDAEVPLEDSKTLENCQASSPGTLNLGFGHGPSW